MMKHLLAEAFLKHRSPYGAVLPYNLNWMLHARDPLATNMSFGPITLVDVGCRRGMSGELRPLRRIVHHIGFDADTRECDRLNSEQHDVFQRDIFPFFIGGKTGQTEFHLFKAPGSSSSLRPDPRYSRLFADSSFAINRTVNVQTTTLDAFFKDRPKTPKPDMIKLDTQGTELAVLQGATQCLQTASLVEVEIEFLPVYKDQALFSDVVKYMLDRGFDFIYLNRVFEQRKGYPGFARGQITFGDALFARREDECDAFDEPRLARYLILLINYGHLDMAHNILTTHRHRLDTNTQALFDQYLMHRLGHWRVRQIVQFIIPFIDKALLLLLHLRKHNAIKIDSDRSWPVR